MDSSLIRNFGCQSHPFRQASRRLILGVQNGAPFVTVPEIAIWFQSLSPLMWEINLAVWIGNYAVNVIEIEIEGEMLEVIFPYPAWAIEANAKWPSVGNLPQSRTCPEVNFPFS